MSQDNRVLVALLKAYKNIRVVTRPEVGKMVGKTVGQIAGICHKKKIIGWPKISPQVRATRTCCFPLSSPLGPKFLLCCKPTKKPDGYLCEAHEEAKYELH